jgi:hypothetical protein
MNKLMNKTASIGIAGCLVLSSLLVTPYVQSQDVQSDWWFDIELIAFKRDLLPNQPEDFSQASYVFADSQPFDLFTLALLKQSNPLFRLTANLPKCTVIEAPPLPLIDVGIDESEYTLVVPPIELVPEQLPEPEPELDIQTASFIAAQKNALNFELSENIKVFCADEPQYQMFSQVPRELFAQSPYVFDDHGLLKEETKFLSDYALSVFRQRDIQPLLYTAWRQPVVFGENNAAFYRIFAGEKLNTEPAQLVDTDPVADLLEQLQTEGNSQAELILEKLNAMQQALENGETIEWAPPMQSEDDENEERGISDVWELDGIFKVYLETVNRVPYLHIDSEFKHYRMAVDAQGDARINAFPLKQRRRIISKQIHYFDHPAFGIIIRLERFEVPPAPIDEEQVIR